MEIIYLERIFGKNLSVRSTVASLFKQLKNIKEPEVVIDFQGVIFMSRSCADEYMKQKDKINKIIFEKNICKDVITMMQIVKSTKKRDLSAFKPNLKVALL